jgi:VanZ family protein
MSGRAYEGYLLLFFELLFLGFAYQAVLIDDTTRFYVVIVSMILILVPILFERYFAICLPAGTKTLIAFALFLHVAGGINRWYWKFMPYYDKVAHVVSALALGLVIFSFLLLLDYWEYRMPPSRIYTGIFLLVLIFGLCWEIGEYYIDVLVKSSYNNGITDSILDLISNTLGSLLAIAMVRHALRKVPPRENPSYLLTAQD